MNVGLLWYDADPTRDLTTKVQEAAQRHLDKYGCWPNACYVHPSACGPEKTTVVLPETLGLPRPLVRCLPAANILLHHLWIGCQEEAS